MKSLVLILTVFTLLLFWREARAQEQTNRILTRADPVNSLPSQNKRWALLIGVDKYQDSNISPLRGAANDANSLRDVLVKYAGFPPDQVIVLSTAEPPERQPTRGNILKRLSNLSGLVPNDGLLLLSFAGHGIERNGQAFLIPSDATLTEDLGLLEDTAVSVTQIKKRIKDTTVKQVMIFLDACRSYPSGRSNSANPLTPGFKRAFDFDIDNREVTAFAVLYATAVGHRAYEYAEKHQGYFSWAIAQALSGAAANTKGEVTLQALVKYLEDNVPKLVALDYGTAVVQKPFAEIEGFRADELILSLASATNAITLRTPEQVGSQPETTRGTDTDGGSNGTHDTVTPLARPGKVLLSRSYLDNDAGKPDLTAAENEFLTAMIRELKSVNLNVTSEWTLDENTRSARTNEFAVNVETVFSVKDLPAYGEMKIAMVTISLRAIDLSSGEIAAVQTLEVRGFGNEQSQARSNALKEASQQIPKDFINQVLTRTGSSSPTPQQTTQTSNDKPTTVQIKGFTFELQSCKISGDEVLCRLLITNNTPKQKRFGLKSRGTRLFDVSGAEYSTRFFMLGTHSGSYPINDLITDVPTTATIKFEGVSTRASKTTLDLEAWCNETGSFKVTFQDVQIVK